ncbi:hypothetical protein WMF04_35095 [Sorangium sp. So ce260]|uniref:hypothetical protein n=1 Tax=Sorangium sp. So ce260 TaxID=3133291 RepID=UPI003F5E3F96
MDATRTAEQDPRAAQGVGVPYPGIVVQAGKDEQRLTGAFAYNVGDFTFDLKLTGANVSKETQRSLLFDAQGSAPGGQLSAGVTWSNFKERTEDQRAIADLCDEQNREHGYGPDTNEDRDTMLRKDPGYRRAVEAKQALEAELNKIGDPAAARRNADETWARFEAARAEVTRREAEAEALVAQLARATDPAEASIRLRAALDLARLAAASAARAQGEAIQAEERAGRAARLPGEVARAQDHLDKEKKRAEEKIPPRCYARSQLSAERRKQIPASFQPTLIIALRGSVEAKSTDYFDTAEAEKTTETVYPLSAAVAAGVYLQPTSLLAVRLDYGRTREANDPTSVCQNLTIDGETTSPATYNCTTLVVGEPTWATKTALRAEFRQYIAAGMGINPSFTYAWAGTKAAPFSAKKGSWTIDVPLYVRVSVADLGGAPPPKNEKAKDGESVDTTSVSLGMALTHRQTWGLGDENETTNDVSVFLGGAFDLNLR